MDDIAARLVHQYQTNCPFEIAEALGIHIRYMDLGKSTKGLYYTKLRRRFIVINHGLSPQWQRFVCAHELGHDRLHKGLSRFFLEEHSYFWPGKMERQANSFAITLLTTGREQRDGETLEAFAMRTGIPHEMLYFFDL